MAEFHFLRPSWFWAILPMIVVFSALLKQKTAVKVWAQICDAHLLQPLLLQRGRKNKGFTVTLLFLSMLCMLIALAGPTWSKITVPIYQHLKPRLLLLDLSSSMLDNDLSPNRLTRAKFKIHDLLTQADAGQFGLMVYSDEPFIVSPMTDDAQTIDVLLSTLSPDILPVDGNRLEQALLEAKSMFTEAGAAFGEILVLTAHAPSAAAVDAAQQLGKDGYHVSVLPLTQGKAAVASFAPLARAGRGAVIPFTDTAEDIKHWLAIEHKHAVYELKQHDDVSLWHDEGRWFLLPGLLLLLPVFRRGWLERIYT